MIKTILTYDINSEDNPPVLRQKLQEVSDITSEECQNCLRDLNDTLDDLIAKEGNKRGAIGLSACQIGYDLAISTVTLGDKRYNLINPVIKEKRGHERLFRIGCFSLYEYRALVRYNDDIVISYYDENGKQQELPLKGDQSCVVQHEMDHLQGLLLFERLPNKEKDLFIPRESLYKDGAPKEKHGLFFNKIRQNENRNVQTAAVYYSSLFNDYSNYVAFVEKEAINNSGLLELVREHTPKYGRVLEVGDGTGSLAVALSKKDYHLSCVQKDQDLLELARRIGEANDVDIIYKQAEATELPFADKTFTTIISREVFEFLSAEDFAKALNEASRIANFVILKLPTIKTDYTLLRGNEELKTLEQWKELITDLRHEIEQAYENEDSYAIFVIRH